MSSRNYALLGVLGVSIAINALQANRIATFLQNEQGAAHGSLAAGQAVPALDVKDLDGNRTVILYESAGKPTLIYVFSPTCPWCLKNEKSIKSLVAQVSSRYNVIGLSLKRNRLVDHVKLHQLPFPVYTPGSRRVMASYSLEGTPETILVSEKGVVLNSWAGAYVDGTKNGLERFFSVRLPGELLDISAAELYGSTSQASQ
jgi:peroxiredoxin